MDTFALECHGNRKYMDIPNSHCQEGIEMIIYPFNGHNNQQWLWYDGRIVSAVNSPNFCLAVREVRDGAAIIIHTSSSPSNTPYYCSTQWLFQDGVIKMESHPDYCIGIEGHKVVLRRMEQDSVATTWHAQAIHTHAKPATSCHLSYGPVSPRDIADSWSLENTICVKKSTDCTYFCTVGWGPSGYSGIQRISDDNRVVIFSMWNDHHNSVREVEHGAGVRVEPFGGEGTGMKSMKQINWHDNQKVTLRVSGRKHYDNEGNYTVWQCTGSYSIDGGDWHLIATFERPGHAPLDTSGFYSFIEDWRRDHYHQGHDVQREAEYSNTKLTTSRGNQVHLKKARFTKQTQGEDAFAMHKAFAGVKKCKCFVLSTGGPTGADMYGELGAEGYEQITSRNYGQVCM